jgi:branched-chain amino acid transport system permease protein
MEVQTVDRPSGSLKRLAPFAVLPVLVIACVQMGWLDGYQLHVLTSMLIWSTLALSVSALFAYAGLLSMAHGALFGIGVYSTALLTKYHFKLSFWFALLVGILVACVVGVAVGAVTVKLRSHYFVIATLALGMIVQVTTETWTSLTAGAKGVAGIKKPAAIGPFDPSKPEGFCILAALILFIGMVIMAQLKAAPIGRAWAAMRDNELLASSVGIRVPYYRLLCFGVSAGLAAAAGSLYAAQTSYISPSDTGFGYAFRAITMGLVGGLAWTYGPVLGAAILIGVPEIFRGGSYDKYRLLIEGVLLIVVMLFWRQGAIGTAATGIRALKRRFRRSPPPRLTTHDGVDSADSVPPADFVETGASDAARG